MAMLSTGYQVACDESKCDNTGPVASTPGEARTRAHNTGFKVKKYPSTEALCSEHKPKEEE